MFTSASNMLGKPNITVAKASEEVTDITSRPSPAFIGV